MKTLKRENEAVQQAVRDALDYIAKAVEKLDVVMDTEPLVDRDSCECLVLAQNMLYSAAEWLNKEYGSEDAMYITRYAKNLKASEGGYVKEIEEF